ncbi:uncharacterized protein LOC111241602 [Vigna radiata var. radiata]|uniref:Uncharacterized protein LOC111241602 n=1 Tax=Vigna radiata var. radiata TaxID=3916 RepID=A0A3Q0EW71_VIGRR|nr:uncharacterized protein LOC111241602 [Vigna radiata var. radiata]
MEKIYNAKRCSNESRLVYTEYQLTGEACHWWSAMKALLEDQRIPVTWDLFKEKFYGEFFPDSVRFAKEVEFLQLTQGGMTVSEYTDRFKHLVRFYTMGINEEWQCRKYENGLKPDLKVMISNLCIKSFPVMAERAKVLERNMLEAERYKKQQQSTVRVPVPSRSSLSLRQTPYSRPLPLRSGSSSQGSVSANYSDQPGSIRCFNCGGPHYRSSCPQLGGYKHCSRYGRNGHFDTECNMGSRAVMRPPIVGRTAQRSSGRAQAVGQVYALTGVEAASSGNLIISTCLLFGVPCCVLFDSGATHSFISKACVEKLGLAECEMQLDLVVTTLAAGEVRTSTVCVRCPIEVEGYKFKVNLICLPLQDLEVILGMDWLTSNHILIDCGKKKLIFPKEEEKLTLTLGQIREDLIEGAMSFLILTGARPTPTKRG